MAIAPITYWNRHTRRLEQELVYGESALRWTYETRPGRALGERLLSRPWVSSLYGSLQDTRWSARKIAPFVTQFDIPMHEYEDREFESFNAFFIRRFKPGARPFTPHSRELAAFAEARYFAMERLDPGQR
ncbi:MAG: phosphatidylserine decarboxylase, partial [Gemmatimonas sp.]